MSSLKRILASRANGALSRGPQTVTGKKYASQNALRHGLLANCTVINGESKQGFQNLLSGFLDRFAPTDDVEFGLVEEMVAATWRLRRAWAMERHLLNDAIDAESPGGSDIARMTAGFSRLASQPALNLLHRYEVRLHCIFQRALYNLMLLRLERSGSGTPVLPNEPTKLLKAIDDQKSREVIDIA